MTEQAMVEAGRQGSGQADDHEAEEHADREYLAEFWNVVFMPDPGAAMLRRQAVHDPGPVGRGEGPHGEAAQQQHKAERPVGESDRHELEEHEREGHDEHPAGGERTRSEACLTAADRGPETRMPAVSGSM